MTLIVVPTVPAAPPRLPGAPDRPPLAVRHRLEDTGLFALERLAELAELLPADRVEHNLAALPELLPSGAAPRLDARPADVVRGIEGNGCWMVLKNVEHDPEYARLLEACVQELEPVLTPGQGSVLREGFVFLSSPGSVTPAHVDHEHNVLLQVRGTKTMVIGRLPSDEDLTAHVEALHGGGHRNVPVAPVDMVEFPLHPGDGVYVPVHAPHLVRNGPAVSVSLSVTWQTPATLREARVHGFNGALRARGLPCRPPGGSVWRDSAKALAWRAAGRLRRG